MTHADRLLRTPATFRRFLVHEVLTPLAGQFPTIDGEVGFTHVQPHPFPTPFCSLCATRGVSQQVVMRWLRHKDSKMVEHCFTLHNEEARRQMRRVVLFDGAGGADAAGERVD